MQTASIILGSTLAISPIPTRPPALDGNTTLATTPAKNAETTTLAEPVSITIATFSEVGSVCLPDNERDALLSKLTSLNLSSDMAITLIAHSDAIGVRSNVAPKLCADFQLPPGLVGHERIAALRALHIHDIGQKGNIPGFGGSAVIVLTPDNGRYASIDNRVVSVVLRRAAQESETSRHVEMIASPRPINAVSVTPDITVQPQIQVHTLPPVVISSSPTDDSLEAKGKLKVGLGVSVLLLGLASVATSLAFGIGAYRQNQASIMDLDPDRSLALESDGYRYARSSVILGVFGVGLTLGGGILTHFGQKQLGKARKRRP